MKTAKIIVTVGCTIGVVLFLSAGFVLYRGVGRFNEAREELGRAKGALDRFYKANPFPSKENVELEAANTEQVDAWFNDLMASLEKGNVISQERSPSRFKIAVEAALRNLIKAGQKAGTELSETSGFAFGFEQYAGTSGTLPKPQDVPRLMEQLVIVNRICLVLFKNHVKAILEVERDAFETTDSVVPVVAPPPSNSRRSSRRGRSQRSGDSADNDAESLSDGGRVGVIGERDLFAKMHFVFIFRAKESALLGILNDLSANPMFIKVTSLSLSKPTPDLVPALADPEADEKPLGGLRGGFNSTAPDQEPEIKKLGPNYPVCGIQMEIPMEVRLELDVYKFREANFESGD